MPREGISLATYSSVIVTHVTNLEPYKKSNCQGRTIFGGVFELTPMPMTPATVLTGMTCAGGNKIGLNWERGSMYLALN